MNRMRLIMGALAVLLLPASVLRADEAADKAAEAVKNAGGTLTRDDKSPGKPVIKKLQTLVLYGTSVTDAGLKELSGLKELQTLRLDALRITDAGLKELAGLKQLQTLNIGGAKVTDVGLKELARLKRLQTLYLAFTQVTDMGLKELGAIGQLKHLSLYRAERVTDQGIAELRRALPKCEISR